MVRHFVALALALALLVSGGQSLGAAERPLSAALITQPLVSSGADYTLYCSAWRYQAAIYITAGHCIEPGDVIRIGDVQAYIVKHDDEADLAAMFAPLTGGQVLTVSQRRVSIGDSVFAYGYGYAVGPVMLTRHVAHPALRFHFAPRLWMVFDASFQAGMSGGPILDRHGEVVSVVQAGSGIYGLGITEAALRNFLSSLTQ